jgi:hypothetical protein
MKKKTLLSRKPRAVLRTKKHMISKRASTKSKGLKVYLTRCGRFFIKTCTVIKKCPRIFPLSCYKILKPHSHTNTKRKMERKTTLRDIIKLIPWTK